MQEPKIGTAGYKLDNEWTGYVKTVSDKKSIEDLVAAVEFVLRPEFENPGYRVSNAPFTFKKTAWGWFDIELHVKWHRELKMKDTVWTHMLVFNENGGRARSTVYFDRKLLTDVKKAGDIKNYRRNQSE